METGCCSLHRLKHRAVIAFIIVCSLLFYITCMHMHFYQRTLELIGSLKNINQDVQQEVLYDLFSGSISIKDGKYVLMKNGYQFSGQYYLFFDSFAIGISMVYLCIILYLLAIYKKNMQVKVNRIEKELCYLKSEIEHFLFGSKIIQNANYKECNYLLDLLIQKTYDMDLLNKKELDRIITFHQNIIHQINTPLSTIKILVEYLYSHDNIDKEYLNNMNYAIEKASDLTRIYLRSSKIDLGKVKYQFKRIELNDIIQEIFLSLQIYADYYQTKLINKCNNYYIYADEIWIKEAIENLLKNSIENAGVGKIIFISSLMDDENIYIYIDDNCNSNSVDKIKFERFQSSKTGIGIGLYLCRQIIEAHLGEIKVEENILGGLRFTIILPKNLHKGKIILENEYENNC